MNNYKVGDEVTIYKDRYPTSRGDGSLKGKIVWIGNNTIFIRTSDWAHNQEWGFDKNDLRKPTKLELALK